MALKFFGELSLAIYPSCQTRKCAKVTHNCVLTMLSWVGGVYFIFHGRKRGAEQIANNAAAISKPELGSLLLSQTTSAVYVIYDAATQGVSGPGTFALVFGAILGEIALMCLEVYMEYQKYVAQGGEGAAGAARGRGQSIPQQIEMTQSPEVTAEVGNAIEVSQDPTR